MNLRSRVGLTGGAAVLSALLVGSAIIYPSLSRNLHTQVDGQLIDEVPAAPKVIVALKARAASGVPVNLKAPVTVNETLMQIVPGPVAAGPSSGFVPLTARDVAVAGGKAQPYLTTVRYKGVTYRLYTAAYQPPAKTGDKPQVEVSGKLRSAGVRTAAVQAAIIVKEAKAARAKKESGALVRVAMPLSGSASTLGRLEFLLIMLTVGGSIVAALVARLAAGRVLRPVRRLTETVEHVTQTRDLTARIQADGRDEIGRLGRSFTAMMATLEDSVNAQRRLVADASHELRTPLTSLTTNLELLAEERGLSDPEAPAMVREALTQAAELRHLVNDLVDLAQFGEAEPHLEDVRLDLLTEQVVTRAAARAPGLRFETEREESWVRGDPAALARAIGNLVDNAVKWSPEGGRIVVGVAAGAGDGAGDGDGDGVSEGGGFGFVTVTDEGPGVPDADVPYIFDRFYRSPAARALPGSGLGLAIVAKVAQTHGGSVTVEATASGSRFRLSLAACPEGLVSPRRRG